MISFALPRPLPNDQLSEADRQKGINAILLGMFFVSAGFFMVIPLMAVNYVENLGWAAGTIGIVLALRQFFQQSITAVFGMMADKIGPKPLLLAGVAVRVVAFVALGYSETFIPVLLSSLLIALSGSLFESPRAAALSTLALPEERQRIFSKAGVAGGVGTAIGTQVGAALITQDFKYVCFGGAVAFVCVFLAIWLRMPHFSVNIVSTTEGPSIGFRDVLNDRVFVLFLLLLSGHWFAYTQFGLTVTLAATDISGNKSAVAWIYLAQTIVTIGLGYLLPRFMERWFNSLQLLILGTVGMGLGLLMIAPASAMLPIVLAAIVFSLGSVIARPGQETVTANLANPRAPGAYFGVASWSLAIGGGLGNYLGGAIYDLGKSTWTPMPWILFTMITLASAYGMWLWRDQFSAVRGARKRVIRKSVEDTQKP